MSTQPSSVPVTAPAATKTQLGLAGNRYDEYLGLLGQSDDLRSRLVLDQIEEINKPTRGLQGVYHFSPNFWADVTGTGRYSPEAIAYLGELQEMFKNLTVESAAAVAESYQAAKDNQRSSDALTANIAKGIETIANNLYDLTTNPDGTTSVKAKAGAFDKILPLLNITKGTNFPASERKASEFKNYITDKYALEKFLNAVNDARKGPSTTVALDEAEAPVEPENYYFREVGNTDKIFIMAGKNKVEVGPGSQYYNDYMKNPNNCYGTGLKGDVSQCNEYFTKCLAGSDIVSCQQFLAGPNFWQDAMKNVETMLPTVALQTLNRFGFVAETAKTSTGQPYKKFPNTTQWLESLSDQTEIGKNQAILNGIKANTNFLGYLDALVTKVNKNPGIADPTYVQGKVAFDNNAFSGSLLSSYKLRPKALVAPRAVGRRFVKPSAVSKLENTIIGHYNILAGHYMPVVPMGVGFMSGGSNVSWDELDVSHDSNIPILAGGYLNDMYEDIMENLQEGGKDLDPSDQETIKKMVNELNVLEGKLFKAASYTDGYQTLINVQQGGNSLITQKNLDKFANKRNDYFERVRSKYQVIFPIFSKLAEACEKETISDNSVITTKNYPENF